MPTPRCRLTVHGRRLLIERIRAGRPVAPAADEMGTSRVTAYKWVHRRHTEGDVGLFDRTSRPRANSHRAASESVGQLIVFGLLCRSSVRVADGGSRSRVCACVSANRRTTRR
ncbi:leucine zipper domain-containing protein [Streptomyces sp. SID3343]|uniref:leucine zipper domain-containing protein n=1 Tax=Streptomyces sp. SID3343 TaxID=2690260 RepID=UPI0031F98D04